MLCGAATLPAASGDTHRHRLNRRGDRQANYALRRIVISRIAKTRTTDGLARERSTATSNVAHEVYTPARPTRCLEPADRQP
ncbi:hypothetical protein ACGF5C_34000 [Micromonospora sp. NPDC047620]|uniref:hypothetical protein n=1 Tax=Micromonospora sp. NPDC047620 TaxID=3364251 RepID=UPI00371BB638